MRALRIAWSLGAGFAVAVWCGGMYRIYEEGRHMGLRAEDIGFFVLMGWPAGLFVGVGAGFWYIRGPGHCGPPPLDRLLEMRRAVFAHGLRIAAIEAELKHPSPQPGELRRVPVDGLQNQILYVAERFANATGGAGERVVVRAVGYGGGSVQVWEFGDTEGRDPRTYAAYYGPLYVSELNIRGR